MNEDLDFSLPGDRKGEGNRGGGAQILLSILTFVLIVALFFLLLFKRGEDKGPRTVMYDKGLLATRLEDRGLKGPAAQAWEKSLESSSLSPQERAMKFFQIGRLHMEAGSFEKALESFYKSELVKKIDDIAADMDRFKAECFRRLGNLTGLSLEMQARTSFEGDPGEEGDHAVVLAEIGKEKITLADLNREMEKMVESQIRQYASFASDEQIQEQKERLLGQFQNPRIQEGLLTEMVNQILLQREALKRTLAQNPANERELEELRKRFFAQKVVQDELGKRVELTESDYTNYYEAHKEEFRVPDKARVRMIVTVDRDQAQAVIDALKGGKSFVECVAEYSREEATRERDGALEGEVTKGQVISGIGNAPEVHAHLFSMEAGEVSKEPVEVEEKFYIFQVDERIATRLKSFDEVKEEVHSAKRREKEEEIYKELVDRLQKEYKAVIFKGRLSPSLKEEEKKQEESAKE